ncbi:MAG: hydrolase [Gammaproteobacteria bacterium]|nr:hydrolase [Gammaproteobacteria bacterium]MDH3370086.1 hydrolase [Gammaproteobacteria bacterium]MDH3406053.1 hydrolase [Gammaproteobacteria bacterium]MDH5486079.1 hydrolase [Gammaproteobacteria bacterium]
MNRGFQPAWWCRGPNAQTLWARLARRAPKLFFQRERLELPDGDFLDLDWTENGSGPIVMVLHGLEGSSQSPYARGMMQAIKRRGWRGVVMHFRGCSGEPNRLARSYHSGDTGDLAHVISTLQQREPRTRVSIVGFSLGGNVLLKWLGNTGRETPVRAAVAVSVPYVLQSAADRLNRGFSRLYQRQLIRSLRLTVAEKRKRIALPIKIQDLSTLKSFRDFDEYVTAPLHGFDSADHYYTVSSSRQYLKGIAVPTLLLHARDDPFMTEKVIPRKNELPDSVTLEVYPYGGHVGFVSGTWPWRTNYWLEERIPKYLEGYF